MREVRSKARVRCDFCRKTTTAATTQRHEIICYRNPERICPECDNSGDIHVIGDGVNEPAYYEPCEACEIARRLKEKGQQLREQPVSLPEVQTPDLPF